MTIGQCAEQMGLAPVNLCGMRRCGMRRWGMRRRGGSPDIPPRATIFIWIYVSVRKAWVTKPADHPISTELVAARIKLDATLCMVRLIAR